MSVSASGSLSTRESSLGLAAAIRAQLEEENLYSPKIPEHFIPVLYRLARSQGRPMTHLVAEAVQTYIDEIELRSTTGRERSSSTTARRAA